MQNNRNISLEIMGVKRMRRIVKIRETVLGDGVPKICIPITAADQAGLREQIRKALDGPCDLVEWRADFFRTPDTSELSTQLFADALELLRTEIGERPLLFTFRTKEEGGECSITPEAYKELNLFVASTGMADLIDVELNRGEELLTELTELLHEKGTAVIGSFHDFAGTPEQEEIREILCRMQKCGVDITKAAVMPKSEADVLTLLGASVEMKQNYADRPFITMSMGRLGAVSRLAGSLTGSAVTFATAGQASAPGQLAAAQIAGVLAQLQ